MVVLEVPGDGLRAGVQSRVGRFLAEPHDEVNHLGSDGTGEGLGAS